jgi:antitoxin FitA
MAQLLIRKLEDDVKTRLKVRAARHGHSLEEEARRILEAAALTDKPAPDMGLGSRIAKRFAGIGLKEGELPELRGDWGMRIPDFE